MIREPQRQGSSEPRAGFYFIREEPELLTGQYAAQLIAHYLPLIRASEPRRFRSFLAFIEDDERVPAAERDLPRHNFGMRGVIRRVPLEVSLQALQDKLAHLHKPEGTPSTRAPRYHLPEHCVLYIGSNAFHLWNAKYNLEETGILKEKFTLFCIAAGMLMPHAERMAARHLPHIGQPESMIYVNCYEKERFNSDSFDHFATLVGLKRPSDRISAARAAQLLGIQRDLAEDADLVTEGPP